MILPDLKTFLAKHWQTKPLLVRQAFPHFQPLLSADELITLAGQDEVESRLIQQRTRKASTNWQLDQGPFDAEDIPSIKRKHWTLLVQGVDLHHDAIHKLLHEFRFISDARLDDVMISLAGDQGGVGPHYDSYDVFLLQAWGRREWRVGPLHNRHLKPDQPLKILADFQPTQTWLLEPGDMLYVPPGWGHDGIARGPCMTYSIGFRTPSKAEFLQAYFNDLSDSVTHNNQAIEARAKAICAEAGQAQTSRANPISHFYTDPKPSKPVNPAEIPANMLKTLGIWARQAKPTKEHTEDFIGRFLSEPKPNVWFQAPKKPLSQAKFELTASINGVALSRASRLHLRSKGASEGSVFFNGQQHSFHGKAWALLSELAQNRSIVAPKQLVDPQIGVYLYGAYTSGWLHLL